MIASLINRLRFTHMGIRLAHHKRKMRHQRFFNSNQPPTSTKHNGEISHDQGFLVIDAASRHEMQSAIKCARHHFSPQKIEDQYKAEGKKGPFCTMRCNKENPDHEPIFNLAKSSIVTQPVTEYFGVQPVLIAAQVWFSPNNHNTAHFNSQLFHFDREDYWQIKCFIPIDDIKKNCGPMTVISASKTKSLITACWKRGMIPSTKARYDDALVAKYVDAPQIELLGKSGSVILVDTTQCLHFGSRSATKPKYHITLQYVTPFSPKLDKVRDALLHQARGGQDILISC